MRVQVRQTSGNKQTCGALLGKFGQGGRYNLTDMTNNIIWSLCTTDIDCVDFFGVNIDQNLAKCKCSDHITVKRNAHQTEDKESRDHNFKPPPSN
jgi:hypothetical protein